MNDASPSPGRKRARFFSRDPVPGFVFGLDTNRKDLRVASSCVLSTANHSSSMDGVGRGSAPSTGLEAPSSPYGDTSSVPIEEDYVGAEAVLAGVPLVPTSLTTGGGQGNAPGRQRNVPTTKTGAHEARHMAGVAFAFFRQVFMLQCTVCAYVAFVPFHAPPLGLLPPPATSFRLVECLTTTLYIL